MIIVDFEVFKFNWLVVFYDLETQKYTTISHSEDLENYYNLNKNRVFIGYNIKHYDQYIFKGILLGFNPIKVNDYIIKENKKGYTYSSLFKKIDLIIYDVFDGIHSLKELEGFFGLSILECEIPFNLDRPLDNEELKIVEQYCKYDVYACGVVFAARIDDFKTHLELLKEFNLNIKNLSQAKSKIIGIILDARFKKRDDEFNITIPKNLHLNNDVVKNFYLENSDYSKKIIVEVGGLKHDLGYGGIHAAIKNYIEEGEFLHIDVKSYYPSLIINNNYMSRNVKDKTRYKKIYDTRQELKALGELREVIYKLVLNMTFGCMKYKYSALYDPLMCNNICVSGQLYLLDLVQKVVEKSKLIQSNTDGIIIRLNEGATIKHIKDICNVWEARTGFKLSYTRYKKVIQKDVNNYILVDQNGEVKTKGTYVKKLDSINYDLAIVNKAIVDYFVLGTSVKTTIEKENNLYLFQKVTKITKKFDHMVHGTKKLNEKCIRYFASLDKNDRGLYKCKKGSLHKIPNSPDHCFIKNNDIMGLESSDLDKNWYIDLANKRINDFEGVV